MLRHFCKFFIEVTYILKILNPIIIGFLKLCSTYHPIQTSFFIEEITVQKKDLCISCKSNFQCAQCNCALLYTSLAQLEFMPQSVTTSQRRDLLALPNYEISNRIDSFLVSWFNRGVLRRKCREKMDKFPLFSKEENQYIYW